jgi:DNA-binding XRE family transcriptional regulator
MSEDRLNRIEQILEEMAKKQQENTEARARLLLAQEKTDKKIDLVRESIHRETQKHLETWTLYL